MKKSLASSALALASAAALAIIIPAVALAENESQGAGTPPPPGTVQYRESDYNFRHGTTTPHGDDLNEASSSEGLGKHASSTPWLRGEKKGLIKHFGTTTPPGISGNHEKIDDKHASTTEKHENKKLKTGLPNFLRWFLGLPATTTVGEIRAELQATTTASTTVDHGFGGFFKNFFGRFFRGGN